MKKLVILVVPLVTRIVAENMRGRRAPFRRHRMKTRLLAVAALSASALSLHAQPTVTDPLSTYLRRSYAQLSTNLAALVETMPADDFGFRPVGAVKEVRAFGDIVAHIVVANSLSCLLGDSKPQPKLPPPTDSAFVRDKARLLAVMTEVDSRCLAYLASMTDAALAQTFISGSPPRALKATRGNSIIFSIAHSNEHYGNLVTYIRAKGLVPPPKAVQASWLSPAGPPER